MPKAKFLVLLTFLISSCCDSVEVARFELSEAELLLIPYQQGDRVCFEHSNGYQFYFETTNNTTFWEQQGPNSFLFFCDNTHTSHQVSRTLLKSSDPPLELWLSI
jgi:hypothetical protein